MKSIDSPEARAKWEEGILNDLSFIKKHKRYKLNKHTITPAGIGLLFVVVVTRVSFFLILGLIGHSKNPGISYIMYGFVALLALIVIFQYLWALKFDTIKTSRTLTENMDLVQRFLSSQNLAFSRHDKAPEVFMIISRNLNAISRKEYREIMVFIADDRQILVNSHFSGSKFSVTPPSGNYKKMAGKFRDWLDNPINKSNSREVSMQ